MAIIQNSSSNNSNNGACTQTSHTYRLRSFPFEVKQGCRALFIEIFARKFASLPRGTRHYIDMKHSKRLAEQW